MRSFAAKKASRKWKILLAVPAVILVLVLSVCVYRAFVYSLPENTAVGGLDLGSMSPFAASRLLNQELEKSLYTQTLSVQLPEETLEIVPKSCSLKVNTEKMMFDVLHGNQDPDGNLSLIPYLSADMAPVRSKLENYAAKYDTELTPASWQLEGEAVNLSTEAFDPEAPGQTLAVTVGIPSVHLDVDGILEEILLAFSDSVTLCRENRYQLTPEVVPEAVPDAPDAAAIARELSSEPVSDAVSRESFAFVPGSYGRAVDETLLTERIAGAGYGETVTLSLQYLPPAILGEDAYFQDVLGAYETRHTDDKNRNHNLQLQCDALDGLVLQPGETFSMNECLGERTEERGYLPAPAYSGNRLVKSPGGGVCQGSSTLYNCVLLADLEVVFRACHGVKVGYVPLGLDAAINWLTTDFQFRNNFNLPIRLRAWLEDGYMKMQILGTDEKDYYIKMETGSGEDEVAYYARSYKCKYDKETDALISREIETFSTYYKNIK